MKNSFFTVLFSVLSFAVTFNSAAQHTQYQHNLKSDLKVYFEPLINRPGYNFKVYLVKPGTHYVEVYLNNTVNLNKMGGTYDFTVRNGGVLFSIEPSDKYNGYDFNYGYYFIPRNLKSKPDSPFVYLLPYKDGLSRQVIYLDLLKTFADPKMNRNHHAVSFRMEKGDMVRAVRKGLVIETSHSDYDPAQSMGQWIAWRQDVDAVIVEHDDGTYAEYSVFESGSLKVKPGDIVMPGDPLGVAGTYNMEVYQTRLQIYYFHLLKKGATGRKPEFEVYSLQPIFHTTDGNLKLENHNTYTATCDPAIIAKELTKKEKKAMGMK